MIEKLSFAFVCVLSCIMCLPGRGSLNYDPFNPNPTDYDVLQARQRATHEEHAALEASMKHDDIGWQEHSHNASRARFDAMELEQRMNENEQHARQRQLEQRMNENEQRARQRQDEEDQQQSHYGFQRCFDRKSVRREVVVVKKKTCASVGATEPNIFDYYCPHMRYSGEFGTLDRQGYSEVYRKYFVCQRSVAEKVMDRFRKDWEYGQFCNEAPHPSNYWSQMSFAKAHAGWVLRQQGLKWSDVGKSALDLEIARGKLGWVLWKSDEQKRAAATKKMKELKQAAKHLGIKLEE